MLKNNRLLVAGCLVLTLCTGCGGGGSSAKVPDLIDSCPALPASTSPAGSLEAIVDSLAASEMKTQGLPGMTVALAKNGTVIYAQGYGYADFSTCNPVQSSTEFQIGSVTKQFTAAAILQLQNAGKLDIDNTVLTYLPGYAFDSRITLRMLLNHTAGLANYTDFPPPDSWIAGIPQETILNAIVQAPLLFTPGSAYSYSNSNYFVLGAIIEVVSSLAYEDYMAANIFQPIGLSHTSYLPPATSASPYSYTFPAVPGTTGMAVGVVPDASIFFSAGTLWSNVQDLATWDAALRNGNVIPASLFTEMVTPPAWIPVFQQAGSVSSYAMGWLRTTVLGHPVIWHNGKTFAYRAYNAVNLDDGFSITILTNVDMKPNTSLDSFAATLVETICTSAATAGNC